jgi:hypothetical protein
MTMTTTMTTNEVEWLAGRARSVCRRIGSRRAAPCLPATQSELYALTARQVAEWCTRCTLALALLVDAGACPAPRR